MAELPGKAHLCTIFQDCQRWKPTSGSHGSPPKEKSPPLYIYYGAKDLRSLEASYLLFFIPASSDSSKDGAKNLHTCQRWKPTSGRIFAPSKRKSPPLAGLHSGSKPKNQRSPPLQHLRKHFINIYAIGMHIPCIFMQGYASNLASVAAVPCLVITTFSYFLAKKILVSAGRNLLIYTI